MSTTFDEVLEAVQEALTDDPRDCWDLHEKPDFKELLEYVTEEFMGERRWGHNAMDVYRVSLHDRFIGVTTYRYSGDGDGPSDAEAVEVEAVQTTTWRPIR